MPRIFVNKKELLIYIMFHQH